MDASKIEKLFQCQRCQECCKQPGFVYLKKGEEDRIANFLKMDIYQFVNQYCEVVDRQRLVLKKLSDESCIFLKDEGCSIQEVKPQQCRDFPTRWVTPRAFEYCMGLKRLL